MACGKGGRGHEKNPGYPKGQCILGPMGRACGGSHKLRRRSHKGFPLPKGMLNSQRKLIRTAALLEREQQVEVFILPSLRFEDSQRILAVGMFTS